MNCPHLYAWRAETSTRQPASVVLLTNSGIIFVLSLPWENWPHSQSSDELSLIGLAL
jgi:hypothetical protein